MPIMDGCDSTIKIRSYLKTKCLLQPVIICVTGQTEDTYVQKAYRSGINGVSNKPVDTKLMEKVLQVLKFIDKKQKGQKLNDSVLQES
mgnify:CR=1 FL=1